MRHFYLISFLMLFTYQGFAQEQVMQPIGAVVPTDPALKDLVWNRYTTDNFVILSIDNAQGKWMSNNLDDIKTWCIERWGFPDFKFTKECRVFCVPNKALLKKLFNLDDSKVEVRRKDGNIEITAMWLVLDNKPANVVPQKLSQLCFAEFEQKHSVTIPFFAKNGMSILNGAITDVKEDIKYLSGQESSFLSSDKMFAMTEEEYKNSSEEVKKLFDSQSVVLCLLLRHEFGELKLQNFLKLSSPDKHQEALKTVYGFENYIQFDESYMRYMKDLLTEAKINKVPDSYFDIRPIN